MAAIISRPEGALVRRSRGVGAFGEGVDEPEHGAVVDALIGRERLDVPTHELAQDALDQALRPAARLSLGRDGPEALGERARRRELGLDAPAAARAAAQLLAEALEEVCDVEIVRRGNACRRRAFRFRPGHSGDCTGRVCQCSART